VVTDVDKISFFRELERVVNELFLPVEFAVGQPKKSQSKTYDKKARLKALAAEAASEIKFRDRIINLKGEVEEKITQIKENIKQVKTENVSNAKEENKKQVTSSTFNRAQPEVAIDMPDIKKKRDFVFETSHTVGVFMIQTQTNYTDLIIEYMREIKNGRPYFYKGLLRIGKVMNATAVEFAPYVNFNGGLGYLWGKNNKMLSFAGIEIDSLNFSNIVKVGKNLIPANNRIGSLRLSHEVIIAPSFKVGAYFSKAFFVSSDNLWVKDSKISGNKYGTQICFSDVFKRINIEAEIFISSYNYKADVFDLNTSTKGFGFNAHFIF
jgi:hypothetical protein